MIIIIVGVILILRIVKREERYILLSEVIPQARIVSQEDGIIEYKGVRYILGTNDLKRKQSLIKSLNLLSLEDSFVVDLRFNRQIIIKINKKGPAFQETDSGLKNLQSRRK